MYKTPSAHVLKGFVDFFIRKDKDRVNVLSQQMGVAIMQPQDRDLLGKLTSYEYHHDYGARAKLDESRPITLETRRCIIQPFQGVTRTGKKFVFHGVFFPEFNTGKISVSPSVKKKELVYAGFPRDTIVTLSAFVRHIEVEYGKTGVVDPEKLLKGWREKFDQHLRGFFRFKQTHFGTYVHATAHTYTSGLSGSEPFIGSIECGYVPECEAFFPLKQHFEPLMPSTAGFKRGAKQTILNRVAEKCVLEAHFRKLFE